MTSRRQFIATVMAGASVLSFSPMRAFTGEFSRKLKNLGYISGILKNQLNNENWKVLLEKSVEYGFTEYEGGLLGNSPKEFVDHCKNIGLKPIAGGIKITKDLLQIQEELDIINKLGMKFAVTWYPWLTGGPFNLEECKNTAELLNKIGELCHKNGLAFCWHNHQKEFVEMEQGLPFDYLIENTDKEYVNCEMDIYWVANGGENPLEVLKKHAGRIKLLHVKDMADDTEGTITCPGSGIINFVPLFKEAYNQEIQHYFVERDKAIDGLACLESSGKYLSNLRF